MVACFRPSLSWTCMIELVFMNHDKTLAVKVVSQIRLFEEIASQLQNWSA